MGVLGGLSGNVRGEVEELGRIREEARRVARDIEEILKLSSSVGSGSGGVEERKEAPQKIGISMLSEDVPQVLEDED